VASPSTNSQDLSLGRLSNTLNEHTRSKEAVRERGLEYDLPPDAKLGGEVDDLGDLSSGLAQCSRKLRKAMAEEGETSIQRVC
jgi:hypothetical protein